MFFLTSAARGYCSLVAFCEQMALKVSSEGGGGDGLNSLACPCCGSILPSEPYLRVSPFKAILQSSAVV